MSRLEIDCPKHGVTMALPVINGEIHPHEKWPADVEKYRRVCSRCLAEAMVSPVRRAA